MKIKVGQMYAHKVKEVYSTRLRVVVINGDWIEVERCESHEGLASDTFPLRKDYLLENYDLVKL
jgi:hypothetical protein